MPQSLRLPGVLFCSASLFLTGPWLDAMGVRSYNSPSHDRFTGFPAAPQINPNHIFNAVDLTGIGFRTSSYPTRQCALVTRQHVLFATHYRSQLTSATLTFLTADNQVVTRTCGTQTILYKDGVPTDLVLVKLNAPLDEGSGISPLPYYNVASPAGASLGVTGRDTTSGTLSEQFPLLGTGSVDVVGIDLLTGQTVGGVEIQSRVYRFDYFDNPLPRQRDDNDCYLESGDSGSPSFVQVGDSVAVIGVHTAIASFNGGIQNLDTQVSHYITELDAVLNPQGYRMQPHSIPVTTLAGSGVFPTATPRKAMALDYEYTVENTGSATAGNVEVQLQFATGEGPDAVSASGWVSYGSGDNWTLRRATLDAGASNILQISWSAAPSTDTLAFTVTRRSDASGETVDNESLGLSDSYADWADGLTLKGLGDDEDGEAISNLLEYALGGDPAVASRLFADGGPLLPVIGTDDTTVTLSHPERSDKAERGLDYALEFSTELSGWSATPPPGFSTTAEPYDPAVPGFVQRRWSWDREGVRHFARLQITLTE